MADRTTTLTADQPRTASGTALLGAVAVVWGLPYLFIKLALGGFSPVFVTFARTGAAAAILGALLGPRRIAYALRGAWRSVAGLAVIQFAVPLLMVAEAEHRVSSALAGILIASEPLWVALLATRLDASQRPSWRGLIGVLVGFSGVVLLLGVGATGGPQLVGGILVVGAACCYSAAALWLPRVTAQVEPVPLIAASLAIASLMLAPFALAEAPGAFPPARALGALVALASVCTALAFPMWFALIGRAGAARASLVTYLSPIVAVALGAVVLGEHVGASAVGAIAMIFAGSLLAAGNPRRVNPPPRPRPRAARLALASRPARRRAGTSGPARIQLDPLRRESRDKLASAPGSPAAPS